jgi:hypothetical protein
MDHLPEYLWFGCVSSTLLAHRSYAQGNDPVSYLDGYGDDVLTFDNVLMSSTVPTVCEAYELPIPVYHCIIYTESYPHPGKACWALRESILEQPGYFRISSKKKHPPELEDAPGFDGFIYFVLVYSQNLSQLIGSEYLKDMAIAGVSLILLRKR